MITEDDADDELANLPADEEDDPDEEGADSGFNFAAVSMFSSFASQTSMDSKLPVPAELARISSSSFFSSSSFSPPPASLWWTTWPVVPSLLSSTPSTGNAKPSLHPSESAYHSSQQSSRLTNKKYALFDLS